MIVHPCSAEGCNTLTMGTLCLDCEREEASHRSDEAPVALVVAEGPSALDAVPAPA